MAIKNKKMHYKKYFLLGAIVLALATAFLVWRVQSNTDGNSAPSEQSSQQGADEPTTEPTDGAPPQVTPDNSMLVENEEYKIRYDKPSDTYTITLYAIINNPSQYDSYLAQLKEYKQKALQYLTQQGVNTNTAKIIYEPEEAKDL